MKYRWQKWTNGYICPKRASYAIVAVWLFFSICSWKVSLPAPSPPIDARRSGEAEFPFSSSELDEVWKQQRAEQAC